MERNCDYKPCGKKYEAKRDSSKFCSTSCRVMFSRANKGNQKKEAEKSFLLQANVALNSLLEMVGKINYGVNPALEQGNVKGVQLPVDYVEFKNLGVINDTGKVTPLRKPKSIVRYIEERLECGNADEYDSWLEQLESDPYLSDRDKQNAKTNII